jgi:hypothetical protein
LNSLYVSPISYLKLPCIGDWKNEKKGSDLLCFNYWCPFKSSSYQTSSAAVQPVTAENCRGSIWSETHPCFTSHKPSACSGCWLLEARHKLESDCKSCQLRSRKGNLHFIFVGYAVDAIDYGVFGLIEEWGDLPPSVTFMFGLKNQMGWLTTTSCLICTQLI